MKKILFAILTTFFIYGSCNKGDTPGPDPVRPDITPTVQNLVGNYKLVKYTNILPNGTEQDITDTGVPACEKDDIYQLKASLVYEVNDGANHCPSGGFTSTWSLNGTTLTIQNGDIYTIRRFNGTDLELKREVLPGTYTVDYWKKQ